MNYIIIGKEDEHKPITLVYENRHRNITQAQLDRINQCIKKIVDPAESIISFEVYDKNISRAEKAGIHMGNAIIDMSELMYQRITAANFFKGLFDTIYNVMYKHFSHKLVSKIKLEAKNRKINATTKAEILRFVNITKQHACAGNMTSVKAWLEEIEEMTKML